MASPNRTRDAVGATLAQPFRFVGRPVSFTFASADTDTEVRHLVGEVPHGVLVLSSHGAITRAPGLDWSKDLAYLRSSAANDEVVLVFVVLKEDPLNVNP